MFSRAYKRYVLVTLTLVYTLNCLDSNLMTLLLQPIKVDLALSDSQVGFVTGLAFGLFYAVLGVPIARWADRGNRSLIASLAIGLWGTTVMLCLLVGNFAQLVAARIAAAIGESGGMPPTYSLLGDYFVGSGERTRAMGIYMLAGPLSALVSFGLGGWLNETYGWRMAFFLIGVPGLFMALLVKLTVKDPRAERHPGNESKPIGPRTVTVLSQIWEQRSTRNLSAALILLYTMGNGLGPWYAAFMMRSHAMTTTEVGVWLGLIFGIGGTVGTTMGAYLAAHWFGNNDRGQMRFSAVTVGLLVPCFFVFLLAPQKHEALLGLVPLIVVFSVFLGPTFALLQRLVVEESRATTMAVVMLLANLIGMGLGPQLVGILSDLLRPLVGNESLRYAMLLMSVVALWSAYHFWRVGRWVSADLEAVTQRKHIAATARQSSGEDLPLASSKGMEI